MPHPSIPDLIAKLEKATGPDRELDIAIGLTQGWALPGAYVGRGYKAAVAIPPSGRGIKTIPHYTASIDAALTLVRPKDDIDSFELYCDCGSWFVGFDTLVEGGRIVRTRTIEGTDEAALEFCHQYFKHIAALKASIPASMATVCKWPDCRCYIPSQPAALNMPDDQWAVYNCPTVASYQDLIASGGIQGDD